MLECPWCGIRRSVETVMNLQQPPNFPKQTLPIYKCDGENGCKMLFSLDPAA